MISPGSRAFDTSVAGSNRTDALTGSERMSSVTWVFTGDGCAVTVMSVLTTGLSVFFAVDASGFLSSDCATRLVVARSAPQQASASKNLAGD